MSVLNKQITLSTYDNHFRESNHSYQEVYSAITQNCNLLI
ncbi:hypothetical protein EVA_14996 [gut metagenome]|uniref:Uncharacterized protein n=1 Tax=gut metagenome TaxID=749906 RepID=J9CAD6_9ZZZZ